VPVRGPIPWEHAKTVPFLASDNPLWYKRHYWQGNYHIYGCVWCVYTVLANPINKAYFRWLLFKDLALETLLCAHRHADMLALLGRSQGFSLPFLFFPAPVFAGWYNGTTAPCFPRFFQYPHIRVPTHQSVHISEHPYLSSAPASAGW